MSETHDKNGIISSVPLMYNSEFSVYVISIATNHEHRIRNLVLAYPPTEDDHPGLLGI